MEEGKESIIETAIVDIETKSDAFGPTQPHNGKNIDRIIVSQYVESKSYVVTYSKEDNSVRGWNIGENGQHQPDVYFKLLVIIKNDEGLEMSREPYIIDSILHEKILLFRYYDNMSENFEVGQKLIDLSGEGRFLQIKEPKKVAFEPHSMGFLPNGDLVLTSLDYKIYLYSFKNKPTTEATLWKYSQVYDTETKSLHHDLGIQFYVYQTKLFIFDGLQLIQWDLLEMTFEKQYDLVNKDYISNLVMNKNETLLALDIDGKIDIFSIETETWISKYDSVDSKEVIKAVNVPVEFVILNDGSEGLIVNYENMIYHEENEDEKKYEYKSSYKFLDPFYPEDAIDITHVIDNHENIIITKSNKKFCIIENKVCVTDGLKEEDTFLNKNNYHSNIYTLSTFKTIQNMLTDIINNSNAAAEGNKIELANGELFKFNIQLSGKDVSLRGATKSSKKDEWKKTLNNELRSHMLSYKQLNNQDLALITIQGIYIYTIVNDSLRLRYLWNNKKWNHYYDDVYKKLDDKTNVDMKELKEIIKEILVNEFKGSQTSLPQPNFITIFKEYSQEVNIYKDLVLSIINNPVEFSKFGSEMLKIAIDKKNDFIVHEIFYKVFEKIKDESKGESTDKIKDESKGESTDKIKDESKGESTDKIKELQKPQQNELNDIKLLSIISLNLSKLHSSLVTKYILHTSIILDPTCLSIKDITNPPLLYAYSKNVYIKKHNDFKSLIISFYEKFKKFVNYLKNQESQEVIPTISFIVPFPQICKKQKEKNNHFWDYNSWNETLYRPESILFCNVDAKHIYRWWNFAAIIDFKWKKFGKFYYYFLWFLYTTFFICFALASTLKQNSIPNSLRMILYIFSISLGILHLLFEILQFSWNKRIYCKDPWNFFDLSAYALPTITSIIWFINGNPPLSIVAISNLLLNFKFLLFFRVFHAYERYFIIITKVIYIVLPFIGFLFVMIVGFAHAFLILLRPTANFSLDNPAFNNDDNNPWHLAIKFNSVSDGTISSTPTLIQTPDPNTNMFNGFGTSLLAIYLLLTGDSGSFSSWTYSENHTMAILLVAFTFFVVIYLMNLFIGLLNVEIENYHKKCEIFLLTKAKVIAEIELFYMLPYHRHNKKEWFPNWIYYDVPVEEVRKFIKAIDNKKTDFPFDPFISKRLRELVKQPGDTTGKLKQIKDELDGLKQQMKEDMKDMQNLLVNLIKNQKVNNDKVNE